MLWHHSWLSSPFHKSCLALVMLLILCACATPRPGQESATLTVFAAASLTEPFAEIGRQFELENPSIKVALVFAGSQQLATQIREGAAVDVFASANAAQMDGIVSAGLVDEAEVRYFAGNRLVVILPNENRAGIDDLQNLALPGIRLVMAAPEVPVGQYTLEFLELASQDGELTTDYKDKVIQNVVSYENDVKAVVAKVVLGEADAGIVYSSDVSPSVADKLIRIEIIDRWNITARYPIAPLNQSALPQFASAFVAYVISPQGQEVLKQSGFLQVDDEPTSP
jgi:molybdate transport system substrate-binding protein